MAPSKDGKKSSCETKGITAMTEEGTQANESDSNVKRHTQQILTSSK